METIKKIFYAALTILFVLIIAFFLTACGNNNQPNKLKDGEWRAEFLVQGQEIPLFSV